MRDKHRTWTRPLPAAKPAHLASNATNQSPAHFAALRGATTAFASSPTAASPPPKQVRGPYGGVSELVNQDVARGRSPEETTWTEGIGKKRSRSRGRHLSPEDAHTTHALSAAMSANSFPPPRPPLVLDRSQSMIAARLVSASPSPDRSNPSVSPPNEITNAVEKDVYTKNSVPQKSRPIAINPHQKPYQPSKANASTTSSANLTINFDTLPKLAPVLSAPSPRTPRIEMFGANDLLSGESSTSDSNQLKTSAARHKAATSSSVPNPRHALLSPLDGQFTSLKKPPILPAPRRGRTPVPGLLKPSLTGPRPGESREEAIRRMADAMVASSLASSRPSSPGKPYKSRMPRRRSASTHDIYRVRSTNALQVAPSLSSKPPKPMKQTLRKHSSDNEEDSKETTKRGRRHLVRKHPNMHHEGDRKRWRDKVTEFERKRYEGVFAANRGLLLKTSNLSTSPSRVFDPNSEANMVVNVVVRDIWERSRLPSHILEQIYDLVASEESLALNREQFVVGLWLIDQKLKGRKLPVRVSTSVWASVRHLQVIKLGKKS